MDSLLILLFRLRKHHNILSWHSVHQVVVCDIVRIDHIESKNNLPDVMAKHRTSREWYELCKSIIFWAWRDCDSEPVTCPEGSDIMAIV